MVSAGLRLSSWWWQHEQRRPPSALTAGPRDDDRLDILPGVRLSQVVEEALQHCRQQGRRAEWAWPGACRRQAATAQWPHPAYQQGAGRSREGCGA